MSGNFVRRAAKPMLFAAAFIWGSSFFIMKNALDAIPVQYLLAIRFSMGALLLALVCWKRWKNVTKDYLWRGGYYRWLSLSGLLHPDIRPCIDNALQKRISYCRVLRHRSLPVLAVRRGKA